MRNILTAFYATLYTAVAMSFVIAEIAATKASWPYISTPSIPMLVVFAVINAPLVITGVAKIVHLVYLHSYQHHQNVMRTQRQLNQAPYPTDDQHTKIISEAGTPSQQSTPSGTLLPSQSVSSSQGNKGDSDNMKVIRYLTTHEHASIREVERATGVSRASVGRTNAWKDRSR